MPPRGVPKLRSARGSARNAPRGVPKLRSARGSARNAPKAEGSTRKAPKGSARGSAHNAPKAEGSTRKAPKAEGPNNPKAKGPNNPKGSAISVAETTESNDMWTLDLQFMRNARNSHTDTDSQAKKWDKDRVLKTLRKSLFGNAVEAAKKELQQKQRTAYSLGDNSKRTGQSAREENRKRNKQALANHLESTEKTLGPLLHHSNLLNKERKTDVSPVKSKVNVESKVKLEPI